MEGIAPDVGEKKLNRLYLAIISRYKDYIEEKEDLSVAELPTLVMPNDERVRAKTDEIKSGFLNYSYDQNFHEASIKAYEFVNREIEDITLPLQFWLTPTETMEFMVGDSMDKNILLCSMLVKLGNPSAKVFVIMRENIRDVFVYYEFGGKTYALERDRVKEFESKDLMLVSLSLGEESVAYEFNNQMYSDIF